MENRLCYKCKEFWDVTLKINDSEVWLHCHHDDPAPDHLAEESREGMQVCTCEPVWDCQGKTFAINPNCKIHGSGDRQP